MEILSRPTTQTADMEIQLDLIYEELSSALLIGTHRQLFVFAIL